MPRSARSLATSALVVGLVATAAPATAATDDVLGQPTKYEVGWSPFSITVGDFDDSGHEDLAVMNQLDNSVSILLGKRGGEFNARGEIAIGDGPLHGTAADFDEDGIDDLATAGGRVSVLLSKGNGHFEPPQTIHNAGWALDAGDLNGDGHADLAVAVHAYVEVAILLGRGDGTFGAASIVDVPYNNGSLTGIQVGDFDGDGGDDLAVADHYFNDVIILRGNGDGTFAAGTRFDVGTRPTNVELADLDEDGHLDVVTANDLSYTPDAEGVSVLHGNGDGTFQPYQTYLSHGLAVGVGDLNGDCHVDVASIFGNIEVLLGDGAGGLARVQTLPAGRTPYLPAVADFNDDGADDIAVPNRDDYPGTISVALSTGAAGCG